MSTPAPDWKKVVEDNDLYSRVEVYEEVKKIVIFSLADEWYGFHVEDVREIVPKSAITWLPFVPPHISGFIQLRGEIVSVSYLKTVLGLPAPPPAAGEEYHFIVIRAAEMTTALWVDGVVQVVDVPVSQIDSSFSSFGNEREKWFKAKFHDAGRLIAVLDVKKILEATKVRAK